MYVNIEFLGSEPIENVITSMHFQMDKTIFIGYSKVIEEYKDQTMRFLKKRCGVKEVVFHKVSERNLSEVLEVMRTTIDAELEQKNSIYVDVTGGESLVLVAFGMLAKEYDLPMHLYDVEKDQLMELNAQLPNSIRKTAVENHVQLNLDMFIEMRGGIIDYRKHKALKSEGNQAFFADVEKLWKVMSSKRHCWNQFCDILKQQFRPEEDSLYTCVPAKEVEKIIQNKRAIASIAEFDDILDSLAATGALMDVNCGERGQYSFIYKSQTVKDCLWEGGSILELHTYLDFKKQSDDCKIGVHIDWDGVVHAGNGMDVVNEIDVLALKGNTPAFISCKSGRMDSDKALHALYELETVSKYFGGRYAKKVLAITREMGDVYQKRAKEMDIELWCY